MRICTLDLTAYGPFTDCTLDLSEGREGLHVVYGDNEAGKSSALRALQAWLFGMKGRQVDDFVHDQRKLRVGGRLRLSGGRDLAFVRRKGNQNTILHPETQEPLPDEVLAPFLGGLDRSDFSRIYGIDHDKLVQGGQEILEQKGDLGRVLFSAAAGLAGLRQLTQALQVEAEALFAPRGRTKPVNAALARFQELQRQVKKSRLKPSDYYDKHKELESDRRRVAEVEAQLDEARRRHKALERVRRVLEPVAQRRRRQQDLDALGEVLLLPQDFSARREKASEALESATARLSQNRARGEKLQAELESLTLHPGLIEREATIEELHQLLGSIKKSMQDRARRQFEIGRAHV